MVRLLSMNVYPIPILSPPRSASATNLFRKSFFLIDYRREAEASFVIPNSHLHKSISVPLVSYSLRIYDRIDNTYGRKSVGAEAQDRVP